MLKHGKHPLKQQIHSVHMHVTRSRGPFQCLSAGNPTTQASLFQRQRHYGGFKIPRGSRDFGNRALLNPQQCPQRENETWELTHQLYAPVSLFTSTDSKTWQCLGAFGGTQQTPNKVILEPPSTALPGFVSYLVVVPIVVLDLTSL